MPSKYRPSGPIPTRYDAALGVTSGGFKPPAIYANRHLQSIVTQAPWRRRRVLAAAAELEARAEEAIIDCGDGVRLQGFMSAVDRDSRGLVVLLHGWEGSAQSSYILSAAAALLAAGFSVFRLNLRDHGDTKQLNEGLFHSCRIQEVVNAVARVRQMANPRRFAIVGQSLGGNFALRIAARAAAAGIAIDRVIAICPVLKPASTMAALDSGFWVYRRYFLARWRRSLAEKAAAFPDLYRFGDLARFPTLTETTRYFVENYTEFSSLEDYLSGYAIIGNALSDLAVSARIILSADDPVIPAGDLPDLARPDMLQLSLLPRGGHCGFVDTMLGPSWIDREIVADLARSF